MTGEMIFEIMCGLACGSVLGVVVYCVRRERDEERLYQMNKEYEVLCETYWRS